MKPSVKIDDFFIGEELIDDTFYVQKQFLEDEDVDSMIYHSLIRTKSTMKKATILFVHGLSEHATRHVELAKKFALADYVVHIFDFRGFGYSSGERNRTPLKVLFEDLITVMTNIRKDLPLFIVAHSMGGGTILSMLLKNPHLKVSGVILSNPFLKMSQEEPVSFNLKKRITSMILPDDFEVCLKDVLYFQSNLSTYSY